MKTLTILLILFFYSFTMFSQEDKGENNFLSDFLVGTYTIVGKKIESSETYTGSMKIENIKGKFKVTRQIGDKKIICEAVIKEVLSGEIKIFIINYTENKIDYEISYMIDTDFDNYARLTGYFYIKGTYPEKPGLEAAFSNH